MTSAAIIVLATGCTKTFKKGKPQRQLAAVDYSNQAERPALKPNHPLHIATTHWARKHQKNPKDPEAALNYARNLRALGAKDKALDVLARSYQLNPGHGALASEYGRVALAMGKTPMAEQLLTQAVRAKGQTDWRVLSALGTVSAKRGDHAKAQTYYLAALRHKPDATSVYNNLALSYALDGKAGDAETLLKNAVAKGHNTPRVRQNLALVLGLQSKFDEAQKVAQVDLATDKIENNVSYLRSMVKANKVAQAAAVAKPVQAKTDTITTAALPARKATPAAQPRAINSTASKTTQPAKSAPPQPAAPVKTAGGPKAQTVAAAALPWHAQKAAMPGARVAHLEPGTPVTQPAASPPANTTWSMTVTEAPARKARTAQASIPSQNYAFPSGE